MTGMGLIGSGKRSGTNLETLLVLIAAPSCFTKLFRYACWGESFDGLSSDLGGVVEVRLVTCCTVEVREPSNKLLCVFVSGEFCEAYGIIMGIRRMSSSIGRSRQCTRSH